MKAVAVLGTGPAGLLAAHAVAMSGRPVALFTKAGPDESPAKSVIGGAQFLHEAIPGLNPEPDRQITYRVEGTAARYQQKVYGTSPDVPFVSFSNVHDGMTQDAWSLIDTYNRLWDILGAERANCVDVNPTWLKEAEEKEWFDLIISTVPATSLCQEHHWFKAATIRVAPECVLEGLPDDTVFYDGTKNRSWYRCSRLFGVGGTEWGIAAKDLMLDSEVPVLPVPKPLSTNCNCFPNVVRLGRMGRWTKGVLAHDGFHGANDALLKL